MPVPLLRWCLLAVAGVLVLAMPIGASPSATALVGCLVVAVAVACTCRNDSTGTLGVATVRQVPGPPGGHPVVRQSQPTAPGRTQARAPGRPASAPTSA